MEIHLDRTGVDTELLLVRDREFVWRRNQDLFVSRLGAGRRVLTLLAKSAQLNYLRLQHVGLKLRDHLVQI